MLLLTFEDDTAFCSVHKTREGAVQNVEQIGLQEQPQTK